MSLTGIDSIFVSSLFVLGGQRLAADLLALIVVLLGWFWVSLHVSAVETGEEKGEEKKTSVEWRGWG